MKKCLSRMLVILVLGALWVVQSGCGSSPPARFYVLSSPAATGPETKRSADEGCLSIGIGPIKIPDYLDQPQIVTRTSPNEIMLAEFDRWAERFKDNFTRVFAKNLSNLLCTKAIVVFPWRAGFPIDYRVEIEVLRLDGSLGGDVSLEAWWMLLTGDGKKMVLTKKSTFTEAVAGKDYRSLVSAQSRAVAGLSQEIAKTIQDQMK